MWPVPPWPRGTASARGPSARSHRRAGRARARPAARPRGREDEVLARRRGQVVDHAVHAVLAQVLRDLQREHEVEGRRAAEEVADAGRGGRVEGVHGELHGPQGARARRMREDVREHGLRFDADDAAPARHVPREEVRRRPDAAAELEHGARPQPVGQVPREERREVEAVDRQVRARGPLAAVAPQVRPLAGPHQLVDARELRRHVVDAGQRQRPLRAELRLS